MIPRVHTMSHVHKILATVTFLGVAANATAQTPVEVVSVVSRAVERQVKLPGEFRPYLAVPIYARVQGIVRQVNVDRGSTVRQGQRLATLEAPEMQSQIADLVILPLMSQPFSSSVCGEWSVAIMSIEPSSKPSHSASWCSFERTGGFIFKRGPTSFRSVSTRSR